MVMKIDASFKVWKIDISIWLKAFSKNYIDVERRVPTLCKLYFKMPWAMKKSIKYIHSSIQSIYALNLTRIKRYRKKLRKHPQTLWRAEYIAIYRWNVRWGIKSNYRDYSRWYWYLYGNCWHIWRFSDEYFF